MAQSYYISKVYKIIFDNSSNGDMQARESNLEFDNNHN